METKFIVNPIENYAAEQAGRLAQCTGVTEAHAERLLDESDANDAFNIVKGEGSSKRLAKGHYRLATAEEIKVVTDAMAKADADVRRKAARQALIEKNQDDQINRMFEAEAGEPGLKRGK